MTTSIPKPRGYIALISTLILSAALTVAVFESARISYETRIAAFELENQALARARAASCVRLALLSLARSGAYRPSVNGDVVHLDRTHTCSIDSVELNGSEYLMHVHAEEQGVRVGIEVRAKRSDTPPPIEIISWGYR